MTRCLTCLTIASAVLLAAAVPARAQDKKIDPERLQKLLEKFGGKIDADKLAKLKEKFGGKIDLEKLKDLKGKGAGAAKVDAEALFKKHDADKDGKLTLEETRKLVEELQTQIRSAGRPSGFDPEALKKLLDRKKKS